MPKNTNMHERRISKFIEGCSARERAFIKGRLSHIRTFNIHSLAGDFGSVSANGDMDKLLEKLDKHAALSRPPGARRAQLFAAGSEEPLTPESFRALASGADLFLLYSTETELEYWCRRLSPYWGDPDWDY